MKLMELLRCYRVANNYSLDALEAETGVERSALFRFECGRGISVDKLSKLINWAFGEGDGCKLMKSGKKYKRSTPK